MIQLLTLLLPLGLGAALGCRLYQRPLRAPRRAAIVTAVVVLGAPVLLIAFAGVRNSEVLGWIGGLSLMVLVAAAPFVGLGAFVGWRWAAKSYPRPVAASNPRAADLARAPSQGASSPIATTARPITPAPPATLTAPAAPSVRAPMWWTQRRGFFIAMAGVGAGFWVFLAIGFWWHGQQPPDALRSGFPLAAIVLLAALVFGVRRALTVRPRGEYSFPPPRAWRFSRRFREVSKREAWLASLAADPRRQRYAQMIQAGDFFWTPDRVEYDLDAQATTCCQHLAPVESAMRAAGLQVRLSRRGVAQTTCRIDPGALEQRFDLAGKAFYEELREYDRSAEDPPQARVRCRTCDSHVWVEHPKVFPGAPVFPN